MSARIKYFAQLKGNFPPAARGDAEWHGTEWSLTWQDISTRWEGVTMFWGWAGWGSECPYERCALTLALLYFLQKQEMEIVRVFQKKIERGYKENPSKKS